MKEDLHIHSKFSDGINSPEEIILAAIKHKFNRICITDHVRRTTAWLSAFSKEINILKKRYSDKITVMSGIEAKVIDLKGNLDILPEFKNQVDLIFGAFHRIPKGSAVYYKETETKSIAGVIKKDYIKSFLNLLKNPYLDIIAHPTRILQIMNIELTDDDMYTIAKAAQKSNKTFEYNTTYNLPNEKFFKILKNHNIKFIIGSDSHSIEGIKP
ncbi:MAG: PHP domain-containing protein [Nanoarchaeota archaeon]